VDYDLSISFFSTLGKPTGCLFLVSGYPSQDTISELLVFCSVCILWKNVLICFWLGVGVCAQVVGGGESSGVFSLAL
jgi:hypothetical protein